MPRRLALACLAANCLHADHPGFLLEGQLARHQRNVEAAYVSVSTRDIYDISWDMTAGTSHFSDTGHQETRVGFGLGGINPELHVFIEALAATGGPGGSGAGLRVRAGYTLLPCVHVGWYALRLAGGASRSEVGLSLGVHFPR